VVGSSSARQCWQKQHGMLGMLGMLGMHVSAGASGSCRALTLRSLIAQGSPTPPPLLHPASLTHCPATLPSCRLCPAGVLLAPPAAAPGIQPGSGVCADSAAAAGCAAAALTSHQLQLPEAAVSAAGAQHPAFAASCCQLLPGERRQVSIRSTWHMLPMLWHAASWMWAQQCSTWKPGDSNLPACSSPLHAWP